VVGDALDPKTMIGPLVAERRDRVEGYIAKGISDGAIAAYQNLKTVYA
jgi:aldehyde dehydrogenase (NAD+)